MEYIAVPESEQPVWAKSILVIPSVSIGNAAQLAVDVIIASLKMSKVGFLRHHAIIPVAGAEIGAQALLTSMEVFYSEEQNLAVVQQRSPAAKSRREVFKQDYEEWLTSLGFKELIILTGSDDAHRIDAQIQGKPVRYLQSQSTLSPATHFTELEHRDATTSNPDGIFIPGGGFARTLFGQISKKQLFPCTLMIYFCGSGDNTAAGFQIADSLNKLLNFFVAGHDTPKHPFTGEPMLPWARPTSWDLMFGPEPVLGLY